MLPLELCHIAEAVSARTRVNINHPSLSVDWNAAAVTALRDRTPRSHLDTIANDFGTFVHSAPMYTQVWSIFMP